MSKESGTVSISQGFSREPGVPTVKVSGIELFDIKRTFDCGQCFRFSEAEDGIIYGTAFGRHIGLSQDDSGITIYNTDTDEYKALWESFFGLDEDYAEYSEDIERHFGKYGDTIKKALTAGEGIRILRQDPWEALCSFIISQNNNIPRIKKIISALCEGEGERGEAFGREYYAFPDAEKLYKLGVEGLSEYRMGFRAKYIFDAAEKYLSGELDFDYIRSAGDKDAEDCLMRIKGVGPKVASCVMLYGFHKTAAFPIDVWIKRVLDKYYPSGIDISDLGSYAGIAQQYLFYYERYTGGTGESTGKGA